MEYHAHIYFCPVSRSRAERLRTRVEDARQGGELNESLTYVGRMIDRPIGPHSLGMFELNFKSQNPEDEQRIVDWLNRERDGLSVLLHEVTGDDLRDHTQGVRWLGEQTPLKLETLKSS